MRTRMSEPPAKLSSSMPFIESVSTASGASPNTEAGTVLSRLLRMVSVRLMMKMGNKIAVSAMSTATAMMCRTRFASAISLSSSAPRGSGPLRIVLFFVRFGILPKRCLVLTVPHRLHIENVVKNRAAGGTAVRLRTPPAYCKA